MQDKKQLVVVVLYGVLALKASTGSVFGYVGSETRMNINEL